MAPTCHPSTLRELLLEEMERLDLDLDGVYIHGWPGCETLAVPLCGGPAEIWISDHDAQLEEPLESHAGVLANLEPQGYGGDPALSLELYSSSSSEAVSDVRRFLGVLVPLLAARTVADLLQALLTGVGIYAGIQEWETGIEGLRVSLPQGGHLFVTDSTGTRIDVALEAHTGLLINRYESADHGRWTTVYDTCEGAVAVPDAVAAVLAIRGELQKDTGR